jgi:hypothetical protein
MVSKRKSNRLMRKSSRRVMRKSNRKSRRGPSRMNLRSPLQVYRDYQKDKEDKKDIILKELKKRSLLKRRKPDQIKRDDKLKRSLDKHRQNMLTKHMIEKYTARDKKNGLRPANWKELLPLVDERSAFEKMRDFGRMRSVKSRKSRKPRKSAKFGAFWKKDKTSVNYQCSDISDSYKNSQCKGFLSNFKTRNIEYSNHLVNGKLKKDPLDLLYLM